MVHYYTTKKAQTSTFYKNVQEHIYRQLYMSHRSMQGQHPPIWCTIIQQKKHKQVLSTFY